MKYLFNVFSIFLIIFVLSFFQISYSQNLPILAVVSFTNNSSLQMPDLSNMGLQFLESALANGANFTLADRMTVQNSLTEIGFSSSSGLVDPSYAIQLGKMLGARYLVTGNVIDVSSKTTRYAGYGIETKRTSISVTVGLRVVDAEKGLVFFIDQATALRKNSPAEALNVNIEESSYSLYQELIQEAINQTVKKFNDKMITMQNQPVTKSQKIAIKVNSEPEGADVEIGGIFYGNTPCEIQLEQGRIVELTVSLSGYIPWIKKIEANPALKVNAKLNKDTRPIISTESSAPNVQVNVGVNTENQENME